MFILKIGVFYVETCVLSDQMDVYAEALQLVISECKPKAKIVDVCEKGDSFIRE